MVSLCASHVVQSDRASRWTMRRVIKGHPEIKTSLEGDRAHSTKRNISNFACESMSCKRNFNVFPFRHGLRLVSLRSLGWSPFSTRWYSEFVPYCGIPNSVFKFQVQIQQPFSTGHAAVGCE